MASSPSIIFDENTGKASAARRVSEATSLLVDKFNTLVDAQSLLHDPDVIGHLLDGKDIKNQPPAIQKAVDSIRQLLAKRLEEADTGAKASAEATLEALRKQLNNEHDETLAALRTEFNQDRETTAQQHTIELDGKNKRIKDLGNTIEMQRRVQVYTGDVMQVVNAFVQLIGGDTESRTGLHPGEYHVGSDNVTSSFETAGLKFTIQTQAPSVFGRLADGITVQSTDKSEVPRLRAVHLETRNTPGLPGLNHKGRQALENVLRMLTSNWFRTTAPGLSAEELAELYVNPQEAKQYIAAQERKHARNNDFSLADFLSFTSSGDHNGHGPGGCPACNAFIEEFLGQTGDPSGLSFDYVGVYPFGPASRNGGPGSSTLGHFGLRRPTGPQANPYHYEDPKE